jgi:hypothetical protein
MHFSSPGVLGSLDPAVTISIHELCSLREALRFASALRSFDFSTDDAHCVRRKRSEK